MEKCSGFLTIKAKDTLIYLEELLLSALDTAIRKIFITIYFSLEKCQYLTHLNSSNINISNIVCGNSSKIVRMQVNV